MVNDSIQSGSPRAAYVKHIVIVGGGTAGWMTAALFQHVSQGKLFQITLIESDEIGTVGVGEASIPPIRHFNDILGIDEAEFMKQTQATFKLGIEFKNWSLAGSSYMHSFGDTGRPLNGLGFHHYWLKQRQHEGQIPYSHFSLTTQACYQNKAATLDWLIANRPFAEYNHAYAYHFDAGLYAAFLKNLSVARGVRRIEGKIVNVNLNTTDGYIDSVTFENGHTISADLFVDCSGFRGVLIEGALKAGYEDWSHFLPCNRAVAVPCKSVEPLTPYTRSTARLAGWQWRIPLQHRIGNGHVYCSDFMSDEEATAILMKSLDSEAMAEPRLLLFTTGKRKRQWYKNCVAIGLSSGFLEPLESTSIHLIQRSAARAVNLLPTHKYDEVSSMEYNRLCDAELIEIRDFLILHYHANAREGSDFWDYCREMPIPETLRNRIELFRARGCINTRADELFVEPSYVAVMLGQGMIPERYAPLADLVPMDKVSTELQKLRSNIVGTVAKMPSHLDLIAHRFRAAI